MDIYMGRDGQRVVLISKATEVELKNFYMIYRLVDANNKVQNGWYVCTMRFWGSRFIKDKVAGTTDPNWDRK